jgi:replication factor C subunit 3/5
MFGPNYHNFVMELNASDDRGIDVIRQQIKEFASTKKIFSQGFKLIILDEADHMTKDAQAALRRVIEKYTKNVRFCLVCNYVNNIIPALQSRCTRFRFAPLKKPEIASRLREIAKKEGIQLENSGLDAIYKLSNGDMRKCLMILQSTFMSFGKVNEDAVYACTGNPSPSEIQKILDLMVNQPFEKAYNEVLLIKNVKAFALSDIIREIHQHIFRLGISDDCKMFLLEKLADIEYNLALGASEKLQTSAMIGAFQITKEAIVRKNITIADLIKPAVIE